MSIAEYALLPNKAGCRNEVGMKAETQYKTGTSSRVAVAKVRKGGLG